MEMGIWSGNGEDGAEKAAKERKDYEASAED
jgi:hypothetical protein